MATLESARSNQEQVDEELTQTLYTAIQEHKARLEDKESQFDDLMAEHDDLCRSLHEQVLWLLFHVGNLQQQ